MKTCSKCKLPKTTGDFNLRPLPSGRVGLQSHCKACRMAANKKWVKANSVRVLASRRKRYLLNPAPAIARAVKYAAEHPEVVRAAFLRRYAADPAKVKREAGKWAREHPIANREAKKNAARRRYSASPQVRIVSALRTRLRGALHGCAKAGSTLDLLGCPPVWLEAWLESLFKPGMTLRNHGLVWHIDHIKPCSKFDLTDPSQQRICFHWTNLQPLFVRENLSKGDKF